MRPALAVGPLLAALISTAVPSRAIAQRVTNVGDLVRAMNRAVPGSVITLADGTYTIPDRLVTAAAGTEAQPIVVRAEHTRQAVIISNGAETAFRVSQPYWIFDGLYVHVTHDSSYGFKIDADSGHAGHHAIIHGNIIELEAGAEAGVKGAGSAAGPWPDAVIVEGNEIYFLQPTTYAFGEGIDAVAVHDWRIRRNVIHGIRTAQNSVAYGAFTKGNSQGTIIEQNLVYDCFIGLSLGGGGTDARYMRDGDTSLEDRDGIIRNNVVINSQDVGLYLYKSGNSRVFNNTFFRSYSTCHTSCWAVDVRMNGATADLRNNILDQPIRDREGGVHTESSNLLLSAPDDGAWFVDAQGRDLHLRAGTPPVDQGEVLALVLDDFDGLVRPGGTGYDVGAFELGGGPAPDAGVWDVGFPDAEPPDLGPIDSGVHPDAQADAMPRDASPNPDASPSPDASPNLDASPSPDARADGGVPADAGGPEDAATVSDGGAQDASARDAEAHADASSGPVFGALACTCARPGGSRGLVLCAGLLALVSIRSLRGRAVPRSEQRDGYTRSAA